MQRCVEQGGRLACVEGAALPRIRKLISSVLSVDDGATSTASLHMAQEIADAALFVLWGARPVAGYHPGRREQPRAPILRRCLQVLAQHEAAPLTLMELCDSAEVPERTLRKVFYEYFGVSPMRLLKLRQLNETNRRLTRGSSAESVTQIFSSLGIWDFSRATQQYRHLFGETPSATLRRQKTSARLPAQEESRPWLKIAVQCFPHPAPSRKPPKSISSAC
jgi:methylphosphotriester-DNA--protein-cysteine methyltransferase